MHTQKFPMVGAPELAFLRNIKDVGECEGQKPLFDSAKVSALPPSLPPDVFADLYGQCKLDPCECLPTARHPERYWKGTACPNWQPMGWTSFEQAMDEVFRPSPPAPLLQPFMVSV